VGELLARVDDERVDRPELARLALHDRVVLARLAEVDRQRDDLRRVLVLDPLQHHGRVQAAGVEQHDAVHLVGLGEVAHDRRDGTLFGHVRASGRLAPGV